MNDYFSKSSSKYFAKPGTEPSAVKDRTPDPAKQLESELAEKAKAYPKVSTKVVIKRYAARKD